MGCAERRGSVLESQLQVHCSPRTPTIRFGNRHRISQERGRSAWNGDYACRGEAFLPRPARPPHLVPAQGAQPHTPGFPALEEVWRAAKARSGCALEVLHSKSNTADTPGLWVEAPAHRGTLQSKLCSLLGNTSQSRPRLSSWAWRAVRAIMVHLRAGWHEARGEPRGG